MIRTIIFFALVTSASADESLNSLIKASRVFSTAIREQIATINQGPSLIEFVAKTIVYAKAKTAYFNALREAAPELKSIAKGKAARPPELDRMAAPFAVVGAKQETVADEETAAAKTV